MNEDEQRQFDDLKQENADMRRKLERREMWEEASNAGATTIDAKIERLQVAKDEASEQAAYWQGVAQSLSKDIGHAFARSDAGYRITHEQYNTFALDVQKLAQGHRVPGVVLMMLENAKLITDLSIQLWGDRGQVGELEQAERRNIRQGIYWATWTLVIRAWNASDDPTIIAHQILAECKAAKDCKPSLETLQRLSPEWMAKLPEPPKKHSTLQIGLQQAQLALNGKPKPISIEERALRTYRGWHKTLGEWAMRKPKFLDQIQSVTLTH